MAALITSSSPREIDHPSRFLECKEEAYAPFTELIARRAVSSASTRELGRSSVIYCGLY